MIETFNKKLGLLRKPLTNQMLKIKSGDDGPHTQIRFSEQLEQYESKTQKKVTQLRSLIEKRGQIEAKIAEIGKATVYRAQVEKLNQDYARDRQKIINSFQGERDRLLANAKNLEEASFHPAFRCPLCLAC